MNCTGHIQMRLAKLCYVQSSDCKGSQVRRNKPSLFRFTLSSFENVPEFRTTLYDTTTQQTVKKQKCLTDWVFLMTNGIKIGKQTPTERPI